jgi:AraC-like DNA-binding protein
MLVFYEKGKQNITCFKGENMNFPAHLHEEVELLFVEEGEIEVTIGTDVKILKKGEMSICLPNVIHSYKTYYSCHYIIVIFKSNILPLYKNSFISFKAEESFISSAQMPKEVISNLNLLYEEFCNGQNIGAITGYMYIIFSRIIPQIRLNGKIQHARVDIIDSALIYISEHYLSPVNLQSIAQALNTSPFHLSRMFSLRIGTRIDQHINELRINFADHLLECSEKSITQIAFECGFETLRTFNRVYKLMKGTTPREYKKKTRIVID